MTTENKRIRKSAAFHIRPARRGDLCVLLAPTGEAEIVQLRRRQAALQSLFDGMPVEPVHLTCQRFEADGASQLEPFIRNFAVSISEVTPIAFVALAMRTLYVPALQSNMLKWQVAEVCTDDGATKLRHFVALTERELAKAGLVSLYTPGAVASLVTALRGVPALTPGDLAQVGGFPHHLFTAKRVVLSRICGPDDFEILATFELT
jgi:hypothetical protein